MATLLSMIALSVLATPAEAGQIERIELEKSSVTIFFDDVVYNASSAVLVDPDRIMIDIEGAQKGGNNGASNAIVSRIRQGQFTPTTTRIVLDLAKPATISSGAFAGDGRSLKVNLVALGGSLLSDALGAGKHRFEPPVNYRAKPPRKPYSVRVRLPEAREKIALPTIYGPGNGDNLPLVVLDAGHGGHDPGAVSPHGGKREKDVTLAIARAVKDSLLKTGRVRVALTREADRFLVLDERFGIARRLDADLFISIHADAAGSPEARGATVYTLSETASDRESARLAARENKSDVINGINLSNADNIVQPILIDLTQRETMNRSAQFAKLLVREGAGEMQFRATPHRFASFVVLKAPDVPSILLETGYLTNKNDVDLLASKAGRTKVADAIANATTVYFARQRTAIAAD